MSSGIADIQKIDDHTRNSNCEPERNLIAAIIMQAVSDVRSGGKSGGQSPIERSARRWLKESRPEIQNSFVNLCSVLGLNPDCIREVVLR